MRRSPKRVVAAVGAGAAVVALGLAAPPLGAEEPALRVRGRSERSFAFPDPADSAPRVDRPWFDASGRLRWDDSRVHAQVTGACDTDPHGPGANGPRLDLRRTRLLSPRVDERTCPGTVGPARRSLLGIDAPDGVSWERDLVFASGQHRIEQWLIGASGDGLVLGSLEVWSPRSGETIAPAATRPVPSESRAVPVHAFTGAALYHPLRRTAFVFDAEVTLTSSRGGLYEVDPARDLRTLRHPVATTLWRGFDRVEEMALTPDGRFLCLAQRLAWRGPTDVSLAILDLASDRLAFLERFCGDADDTCADPHVIVGAGGAIGFSYANLSRRTHHLLRYEIGP